MRNTLLNLMITCWLCTYASAWANPQLTILGLFKNKAIVKIDGHRRVLSIGQRSPEGVKLVSASSGSAVLDYQGQRMRLGLGQDRGRVMSAPTFKRVQLLPDANGMYRSKGRINGNPTAFLVDTGATFIAMNSRHAKRLRLRYKDGRKVHISTASGVETGHHLTLDRVQLGGITLNRVDAVVLNGDFPQTVLLGMSFLNRVKLQHKGGAMILEK